MDKTVTVLVERKVKHPLLGKMMRVPRNIMRMMRQNEYHEGDVVTIEECRPIVKNQGIGV